MVDLLKELSAEAQSDASVNLPNLAQFVRAGRNNPQELHQERLHEAHRIFDLQVSITCLQLRLSCHVGCQSNSDMQRERCLLNGTSLWRGAARPCLTLA